VCAELEITVRQYGWSGEKGAGFLARMTNDCLRFHPTLATTCYGMNDHEYRPYEERIGKTYREQSTAVVRAFKAMAPGSFKAPRVVSEKCQAGSKPRAGRSRI